MTDTWRLACAICADVPHVVDGVVHWHSWCALWIPPPRSTPDWVRVSPLTPTRYTALPRCRRRRARADEPRIEATGEAGG